MTRSSVAPYILLLLLPLLSLKDQLVAITQTHVGRGTIWLNMHAVLRYEQ